jgi:hypothetical protein
MSVGRIVTRLAVVRLLARIAIALATTLALVAIEQLLWGHLYFASPVSPGFERRELAHVIIYVERASPMQDFAWVDAWIEPTERFHQLHFARKPSIYFFASDITYARRVGVHAGGVTAPNGVIAIAPWVQRPDSDGSIWVKTYVRHELSHAILAQNRDWFAKRGQPAWLGEGLAMYFANQRGTARYPTKSETMAWIAKGNWVSPQTYGRKTANDRAPDAPNRVLFAYSEFACIVEDLDTRFGHEALLQYIHAMLATTDHDAVFRRVFGVAFNDYLTAFRDGARATDP